MGGDFVAVWVGLAFANHRGLVVDALARKDLPLVEAGGGASEVPFSEEGGLVAGGLQEFGEGGLRAIEASVCVIVEAVAMRVLTGEERCATRTADRIGYQAAIEAESLFRDAIDIGGLKKVAFIAIAAQCLASEVIGKKDDDIGAGFGCGF